MVYARFAKLAIVAAASTMALAPAMAYDCDDVSFSGGVNFEACAGGFAPPPNDSIDAVNALGFGFTVTSQYKDETPGAGSTTGMFDAVGTGNGAGTIDFNTSISDTFVLVLKLGQEWSAFVFDDDVTAATTWSFSLAGAPKGSGLSHAAVYTTAPIPEPSTYALMLAGLGAVGFMARRRRQD